MPHLTRRQELVLHAAHFAPDGRPSIDSSPIVLANLEALGFLTGPPVPAVGVGRAYQRANDTRRAWNQRVITDSGLPTRPASPHPVW